MVRLTNEDFIQRAKEIHGDKYDYSFTDYKHSLEKVKVICKKHGQFFIKPSNHINNKQGCPLCGRESCIKALSTSFDNFISRIKDIEGFENYNFSSANFPSLKDTINVVCKLHGPYKTTPRNILRHNGCWCCPGCRLKTDRSDTSEFIKRASLAHNDYYDYSKCEYEKAHKDVTVTCPKHGDFIVKPYIHVVGKGFCPSCTEFVSSYEKEIADLMSSNCIKVDTSYRKFNGIKEVDIVAHDHRIGIEINGLYWHSDLFKSKTYHIDKTNKMKELGYRLIHIFEDDWLNKKDICKSIILNACGKSKYKIYARECTIREVSNIEANKFLIDNHIQGGSISKVRIGLYYEDELVSLMSFSSLRKCLGSSASDDCYELIRFCSKKFTNVIGGASRLFSFFNKNYSPKLIISYSDKSRSSGNLYKILGFTAVHDTKPNYFYTRGGQRFNRFKFRKSELIKLGAKDTDTEKDFMKNLGYNRVYNCGCTKFEYKNI